jgi:aminopeptidase N
VSRFAPLLFLAAATVLAQAPRGIPRELASARAREISDVRYELTFSLDAHPTAASGHETLRFKLNRVAPLLLDFRDGAADNLRVNGEPAVTERDNGHILLPANRLRAGDNAISIDFTANVAAAGKAITRFDDKDDGSTYVYTLFVPMDASMAFPCFDQPDIKGRFTLALTIPTGWSAISNSRITGVELMGAVSHLMFAETSPLSTYLFAFAAGPFETVHRAAGLPNVYVRKSQVKRAQPEIPQIQDLTARGMKFLAGYFAQPFPFSKYDMVLIPGFPYGGMEHAGATFLNEDSILFRTAPTETDRFNRGITVLHELAHQWFGDFTTMRWFDDLWLKEGFAQYMAFRTMAALAPGERVWKRFYQQIKPSAYAIDETSGTTPIYQDIPNLLDAKSAYGAIVYSKAPGLLRQLAYLIGDEQFRNGLRLYLHEHPYGNAQWSDLIHAFERASGQNLNAWAAAWIERRGMPEITVDWSCDGRSRLTRLTLHQENVLGEGGTWPVATEVLLGYTDRPAARIRVQFSSPTVKVREATGVACPAFIFANNDDYAYGLFLLDSRSREYVRAHVAAMPDVFERTLLWGALWDSVRFVQLAPRDYLAASIAALPHEADEALVRSLGARSATALHRYVNAHVRRELTPNLESIAIQRSVNAPSPDLRIMWFRTLNSVAATPRGLGALRAILQEKVQIPGVKLRSLDRWSMVGTLLAQSDPAADEFYSAEQKRDTSGEGLKYSYVVAAARPQSKDKAWYFNDYLHNPARREDWVEQSLGFFNEWNQPDLTLPYLRPALQAIPRIKQQRKIFFLVRWLNAFIGGQQSETAAAQVHDWLRTAHIDEDLRLKVLQEVDELDRTVKIRHRFP